MTIGTFNILSTKPKVVKTRDGTDVAARYFVYKLHEATDGQPMQWQVLLGMGESAATISRARMGHSPGSERQAVGTQGRANRRRAASGP
jgi:hypothetical protein